MARESLGVVIVAAMVAGAEYCQFASSSQANLSHAAVAPIDLLRSGSIVMLKAGNYRQ